MSELVDWLLEQIAEDEAKARAVKSPRWVMHDDMPDALPGVRDLIVEYGPARVLAECAAKRKVIALWDAHAYTNEDGDILGGQGPETHHDVLLAMAQPYADRSGFKEAWRG